MTGASHKILPMLLEGGLRWHHRALVSRPTEEHTHLCQEPQCLALAERVLGYGIVSGLYCRALAYYSSWMAVAWRLLFRRIGQNRYALGVFEVGFSYLLVFGLIQGGFRIDIVELRQSHPSRCSWQAFAERLWILRMF